MTGKRTKFLELPTDKGWVDGELFKGGLVENFIEHAVGTRPLMLLLDGHSSHYTPELIDFAKQYGILLTTTYNSQESTT